MFESGAVVIYMGQSKTFRHFIFIRGIFSSLVFNIFYSYCVGARLIRRTAKIISVLVSFKHVFLWFAACNIYSLFNSKRVPRYWE